MYCRHCGKEIPEDKTICPYCAHSTGAPPKPAFNYNPSDGSSFWWALLGFLIPVVGLVLYLVWRDEYPLRASSAGKGALVCVILYVILVGLSCCVVLCAV